MSKTQQRITVPFQRIGVEGRFFKARSEGRISPEAIKADKKGGVEGRIDPGGINADNEVANFSLSLQ